MLQRRQTMTDSAQPFAAKKFLEINGRRMAYIDEGEGAPIVFAHGNPTSSYLWRNVMPACRGLGRLIACDMIGMGDSEKLPDSGPDRYMYAEQRSFLFALWKKLSVDEMAAYRAPFANAGEDRRPILTWLRQIPIEGETSEVVRVADDCGRWLADSRIPKLFINAEPGAVLTGRRREFCRTWRNQTEVTVEGIHFLQEDGPDQIGQALAAFVRSLRSGLLPALAQLADAA